MEKKINIQDIYKILLAKKKKFMLGGAIAFVLSCVYIFPQPRYYETNVTLAPESNEASATSTISSIASSFGFDLGNVNSTDAIYPMLYPDVIQSQDFIVGLFEIPVEAVIEGYNTTYYEYIAKCQKKNIYLVPFDKLTKWITKLMAPPAIKPKGGNGKKYDPFWLTKEQHKTVEKIKDRIECAYDLKTEVITLTVLDQDPLVCACMADSVRQHLQDYIIEYRTRKASNDAKYYRQMVEASKAEFDSISVVYSQYCDSHFNTARQTFLVEQDKLQAEMNIKQQAYTAFVAQLQAAEAKIQECTPAFCVIQSASVPEKPSKPKRLIFVGAMVILTLVGQSIYFLREYIF